MINEKVADLRPGVDFMEADARKWLQKKVEPFLRRVGLRQGQVVLDFGCNEGNYTIPAARIVGETGNVYALDKDSEVLARLMQQAAEKPLSNVKPLHAREDEELPLRPCSVDLVLLYDVLHRGYLPEKVQRERVLRRIHRVLKSEGLLSCYPTHLNRYGMTFTSLLKEIAGAGFRLTQKHRRIVVHDGNLVRGWIFSFRKDSSRLQRR